jgi:hypothetical protein
MFLSISYYLKLRILFLRFCNSYLDPSSNSFPIPMEKHIGTRKEDGEDALEEI